MNKENFRHTVLFWLKEPKNESHRNTFEIALNRFINNSEYVQNKHLGTAPVSTRDVVDSSFTYCLAVSFLSKEDQDKYQEESVHLKFIEEASHLWDKVVVYNSVLI
ncbi:MAG: Dabb family protein [Algibacter sp.]